MEYEEKFKDLLTRYLREVEYWDIKKVLTYSQGIKTGGYCDTCFYEEIVVDVSYVDHAGDVREHYIYGDMGTLIRDLDEFSLRIVE